MKEKREDASEKNGEFSGEKLPEKLRDILPAEQKSTDTGDSVYGCPYGIPLPEINLPRG